MRRNWYTTTGLAVAIASLVLAGCGSADAGEKNEKEKVEKVEKVEVEKEKEGKAKPGGEKRGLSDPQKRIPPTSRALA